jgi:hypothetical protein
MMTKEKFVEIINEIQELHKYEEDLYVLNRRYKNYEVDFQFPTLEDIVVRLLEEIFQCRIDEHIGSDISYFIYDLNFGQDWEPGMIIDKDGNDIDHSTAEKLYDYLMKERDTN